MPSMPFDCDFLCLFTERRRHIEFLWRSQLLITADERKARRRFKSLMKGFDTEDLAVLRKAIKSKGSEIMACAPGPPMDLVESEDDELLPGCSIAPMRGSIGVNPSRLARTSSMRYSHRSVQSFRPHRNASTATANHTSPDRAPTAPHTPATPGHHVHIEDDEVAEASQQDDCGLIPQIDRPMSMPYLCCKMWRWKELQVDAALHRLEPLPWCRFGRVTINNATVSCCNPYHYGLWIRPEASSNSEDQSVSNLVLSNGGVSHVENSLTTDTGYGGEMTGTSMRLRSLQTTGYLSNELPPPSAPPSIPPTPPPPSFVNCNPAFEANENNNNNNNDDADDQMSPARVSNVHAHAIAWGKLARWECRERVGEVDLLVGKFVALGKLAGTVHDGQSVKHDWDIANNVSFSLMRRNESEFYEDVWLYNSGEKPLFICLSHAHKSENIRRLSPGYCIRVHRIACAPDSSRVQINDPANSLTILTISVGSGWGINYQPMYVTDMPCRYEVIFT